MFLVCARQVGSHTLSFTILQNTQKCFVSKCEDNLHHNSRMEISFQHMFFSRKCARSLLLKHYNLWHKKFFPWLRETQILQNTTLLPRREISHINYTHTCQKSQFPQRYRSCIVEKSFLPRTHTSQQSLFTACRNS